MNRRRPDRVRLEETEFRRQLETGFPPVHAREQHRRMLWLTLQGGFERDRGPRPAAVLKFAVMGIVILVLITMVQPRPVVTTTYDLSRLSQEGGSTIYTDDTGKERFSGLPTENSAEDERRVLEAINETRLMNQAKLRGATGFILGADTLISAEYEYEVEGKLRTMSRPPREFPAPPSYPERLMRVLADKNFNLGERVINGQAEQLPPIWMTVDGQRILMQRWRTDVPGGGQLTYLLGSTGS
jgi:hypothetical protein